jgi:hypothetical protein
VFLAAAALLRSNWLTKVNVVRENLSSSNFLNFYFMSCWLTNSFFDSLFVLHSTHLDLSSDSTLGWVLV